MHVHQVVMGQIQHFFQGQLFVDGIGAVECTAVCSLLDGAQIGSIQAVTDPKVRHGLTRG